MVKEGEEGLRARRLLDKVEEKLKSVQLEGEERIIFIIDTLGEELIKQGYDLKKEILISLWKFPGQKLQLDIGHKTIGDNRKEV